MTMRKALRLRLGANLLEAARKLAEGESDNIDLRMTPQNPTGCFEDEETRDAYWDAVGCPSGTAFEGRDHRVTAMCLAAAVYLH
jgi:hypothetical protein